MGLWDDGPHLLGTSQSPDLEGEGSPFFSLSYQQHLRPPHSLPCPKCLRKIQRHE